ncbi:chemotaxis protein [Reichenbachiella ulvae]|uniref:Chemotaxis protein n=1 Tax=Reichenbachiella ulvae TaxID=2980104 RepID=A0ABT3CT24_9BACT|nr:chemotaxis protein [Reichenbachiella ulvae]MCV9386752.1 chemotaxis protein [Reichenbachiella ulvae]
MSLFSKFKWVFSILLIFAIVLATNLVDKGNFDKLKYSIETIYKDRLVAKGLIFELSYLIQEKQIALLKSDSLFYQQQRLGVNDEIKELIAKFEKTELTIDEFEMFEDFRENVKEELELEKQFIDSGFENREQLLDQIYLLHDNLHELSKIQLSEGKRQMSMSQKTMDTIELFTQMEIIFLIVIAIIAQVIVLYKSSAKPNKLE